MKQLQRLLFRQGNRCFFCAQPIPEGEASVEHLDALSNGGEKNDLNCVACCKAVNTALSNLSLKDKFRVVLNQPGSFRCPSQVEIGVAGPGRGAEPDSELFTLVVENLRKRASKRPVKLATLRNAVAGSFPKASPAAIEEVLSLLERRKVIAHDGTKVTYPGLASEV